MSVTRVCDPAEMVEKLTKFVPKANSKSRLNTMAKNKKFNPKPKTIKL